jgi:hypothetical protein
MDAVALLQIHQRGLRRAAAAVLVQHMGAARLHAGPTHAALSPALPSVHPTI